MSTMELIAEHGAVNTEVWVPDPERPGYLKLERRRSIAEVFDALVGYVGREGPGHDESFNIFPTWRGKDWKAAEPWPEGRISVTAETGGNEGWYVSVRVRHPAECCCSNYDTILSAKTFDGWDAAWDFAKTLAWLLGV